MEKNEIKIDKKKITQSKSYDKTSIVQIVSAVASWLTILVMVLINISDSNSTKENLDVTIELEQIKLYAEITHMVNETNTKYIEYRDELLTVFRSNGDKKLSESAEMEFTKGLNNFEYLTWLINNEKLNFIQDDIISQWDRPIKSFYTTFNLWIGDEERIQEFYPEIYKYINGVKL